MCGNYSELQIVDDIPNLEDKVLEEEITLLAPHFAKRLIEALGLKNDSGESNNQGSIVRAGLDRQTG